MENDELKFPDPPADWQPDTAAALIRLRARIAAPPKRAPWFAWPIWISATLAAAVLLWPPGRGAAQQLWQLLVVAKPAFVRVNPWPKGAPGPQIKPLGLVIPPQTVRDLDEARRRVQYEPRLPHAGVLSGYPSLLVTQSVAAGTVVKVADLEESLRQAGVSGVAVPKQWEGARLSLRTSSLVIAQWPDVVLVQSLPLTLTMPPDFDFSAFSALILRIGGVGETDARRLAEGAGTLPPWLIPIPRDLKAGATMERISLNGGPATLVQDKLRSGADGPVTIVWTVPDRVYLLHGSISRQLAITAANAVE